MLEGAIVKYTLSICLTFFCITAFASPYFFSNPYSPYPPGCVTTPQLQQVLAGDNVVKVWSGAILLAQALAADKLVPVDLAVYRAGCAEPNRSLILLEFSIPEDAPPDKRQFVLPEVVALGDELLDENNFPMTLASEPNSWGFTGNENQEVIRLIGDFTEGLADASQLRWVYVLDVPAPPLEYGDNSVWNSSFAMSAPRYNDLVGLRLDNGTGSTIINIAPTEQVLDTAPAIELNGRLSGNWVVDGASDQGVMLSFSSKVGRQVAPVDSPLVVFFSWYTFDAQGEMLWLTGTAEFQPGATEVDIPLVAVSNGRFMSGMKADREEFGQVQLTANNCNDIAFTYILPPSSGLASGGRHLQRVFALEIAGFACRDFDTKLAGNLPGSNRRTQ